MNHGFDSRFGVGFAKRDITPALGTPLAGRPTLWPRRAKFIRDPLFARALHVESSSAQLTVLAVDLCLVTSTMHEAIAAAAGVPPTSLLVCATHTHSATGGFWPGNWIEPFMGPFRPEILAQLVGQLASTVQDASSTSSGCLSVGSTEVHGASFNRRGDRGTVDPTLTLLRFDVDDGQPICVVAFGAHAVGGVDWEPRTVTADYPGEVCRRLEARGYRPLYLLGAAAGTSPGWLDVSLNDHIQRMGDALEQGIDSALQQLSTTARSELITRIFPLEASAQRCRILPDGTKYAAVLDVLSSPIRAAIGSMSRQGFRDNRQLSLAFAQLGEFALLGVPCEIGPGVSLGLRDALVAAGFRSSLVVSMCNGYAGYAHLLDDHSRDTEFRKLMLYENAMSFAGWDFGKRIVGLARTCIGAHSGPVGRPTSD